MKYGYLAANSAAYMKYAENVSSAEEFVSNAMKDRKGLAHITAGMINEGVREQLRKARELAEDRPHPVNIPAEEFKPLPELSEKVRAERRALSDELHRKYFERIGNVRCSGMPEDNSNLRYTHDLMLKVGQSGEVADYNNALYENMSNPGPAMKEVIKYHYDMLKELEPDQLNADELVSKDYTDKELVDNFERIRYCSQLIPQFQNIREYFKKNNIKPTDEEDKQRLDECEALMNKYTPYAFVINNMTVRMGLIENPYYELCDVSTKEFNTMSRLAATFTDTAKLLSRENDPVNAMGRSDFQEFVNLGNEESMFSRSADVEAAEKHFSELGVDPADLEFRLVKDGKATAPQPFTGRDALNALMDNYDVRIEIVNKNDPSSKVALFSDTRGEFARSRLAAAKTAPRAPERPNLFKRLMHKLSNSNYKKEFDNYYKAKTIYDAYTAVQKHKANTGKAEKEKLERTENARKAQEARERMRTKQNSAVLDKLASLPHKTSSDLEFHNMIVNIIEGPEDNGENEKMRGFLLNTAASDTLSQLYGLYSSGKIDVAGTIKNFADGKTELATKADTVEAANDEPSIAGENQKDQIVLEHN